MCNREIHIQFLKINQSYCLYCDKYLKNPQYRIIKSHDKCDNCNDYNYIVDDNAQYCKKCASLIKYFNADLQPYETYNKKKQSIYHRKYHILNTINGSNKKYNIFMDDYQKYIMLSYCTKINQWEQDHNSKHLNIKYIIQQIYIEFFHHEKCNGIKNRNNVRKLNDYLISWQKIKENINFDIPCNI